MLVISSREFRTNRRHYFEKVDEGQELIIQRGNNKSCKIVPVLEDDIVVSKKNILLPDKELSKAITAEELIERLIPRIEKLFDK
jgi:antitoxin (DNA-binding transcriptional repressor) of toxin-antitoxin stability system